MDIKSYIASGMLEAYVMGILETAEMQEVAMHAAKYPEIQQEIARIEEAMERVAMSNQVPAAAGLEEDLMQALSGHKNHGDRHNNGQGSNNGGGNYLKLIAGLLGIVSLALAGLLYKSHTTQAEQARALDDCKEAQLEYADNINRINTELQGIGRDFNIATDPNYQSIALAGTEAAPDASAVVFWNANTSDLYLRIVNLQTLSANQQYQLWAIIDGQPVDAGVFDLDSDYLVAMKSTTGQVSTFAVTIEPRGGSSSPTLETMQVAGNL